MARIFAMDGRIDSCFSHLNLSYNSREVSFRVFKIEPAFEKIRNDLRYKKLYQRSGFDNY